MKIQSQLLLGFALAAFMTVATGGLALYFLYNVAHSGDRVGRELAPLGDAAMEIKLTATQAHLLFEEIMAGDEGEDINEVWSLLEETQWYANAILNGGENDEGRFYATDSPEVRSEIESVIAEVNSFIAAARSRYAGFSGNQGVGSDADDRFDGLYEDIQAVLSKAIQLDLPPETIRNLGLAKYHLANGHLYLAEILGGDAEESFDAVINDFKTASGLIAGISDSSLGLAPLPGNVAELTQLAQSRHASMNSSNAAGSEADEAFDQSFEKFITQADSAEEIIHDAMDEGLADLGTAESFAELTVLAMALISFITATAIAIILARKISKPISDIAGVQAELAAGNLDAWVPEISSPPEIASLCKSMYRFKQETRAAQQYRDEQEEFKRETHRRQREIVLGLADSFETAVGGVVETLTGSVDELSSTTTEVSEIAKRTADRSNTVRDSASDAANDISAVTNSVNEVNSAVTEVASNVTKTSSLTNNAAKMAAEAAEKVSALNAASAKINDIVSLIADIAEQTNLLALNATIEAARAGDAGKGFAVVANEVKSLATQTQRATDEIGQQVNGMLTEIRSSTDAVRSINNAVKETNETMTSIASAVEEQAATTGEVARAASAAAQKISAVVQEIDSVAQDASLTGEATGKLQVSATELSNSSGLLTSETERFISHIRQDDEEPGAESTPAANDLDSPDALSSAAD